MKTASRPVTSPRQQRSVEARQRILDEALKQFSMAGFDGVSIRDIAAAVGMQHGALRYYFANKEQLWREAVLSMYQRQLEELQSPQGEDSLPIRERFRRFLCRYIRYSARHPEHARIILLESVQGSERLDWAAREVVRAQHQQMKPMMEALVREGLLPDVPVHVLIYGLAPLCYGPFVVAPEIRAAHGTDPFDARQVDLHSEMVCQLVLRQRADGPAQAAFQPDQTVLETPGTS